MHERILLCYQSNDNRARLLNILGDILLNSYQLSGTVDDVNQAVCAYSDAVRDDPGSVIYLADLGTSLQCRFECLGSLLDINQSVEMLESAVQLTPDGHPDKPSRLNNLGNSLLGRFERLGDLSNINKSVLMFEDAVKLTPDGHPEKPSRLNNLGYSLLRRFERLGDLSDMNKSVLMFEDAVKLTPNGHPDKPSLLNNLGSSLLRRFERLGDLKDAVKLTPDGHPDKPSRLSGLGNSLLGRFEQLGDLNGHPDKPSLLNNLGYSLLRRFERLGDLSDINKSLTPDGHPDKPSRLSSLGNSLLRRFERLGDLKDAVKLTPDGHPDKPSRLSNLGSSLSRRFHRLGDLSDINKSVLMFEDAVKLTPDGHPDKPSFLSNLGNSLWRRFQRLGDLSDINKSVLMFEDAVKLTPDGHPDKPPRLSNLGTSLSARFERLGDLSDINKSLTPDGHPDKPSLLNNLGNSLDINRSLTPDGHPDKPSRLSNLGNSLSRRFERLGDLSDINKSVLMFEDAVKLTPDGHPDKPSLLNNLGNSLLARFEQLGDLSDINKSVLMFEDAVKLTPDGHPVNPSLLSSFGNSLLGRFERLGDLKDAIKLTPDGHPEKPSGLYNLGNSFLHRFERLHDPEDFQQLILHYTSAACSTTGPATIRFNAAKQWAKHAHIHQHSSLLPAYTIAIELLPELAWLGLDAASAAIAAHDYQKAVEWLEQGRSVIWGQLLNLRTPLVSLSKLLETAGARSNSVVVTDATQPQLLQSIAEQSHAHALERNHVLQQIRAMPGFESFLLPKPISELSVAAKKGPVAILNTSSYGCDALILLSGLADEVIHVPLSDFTIQEAQAMAKSLASIVGTSGRSDRLHGSHEGYMAPDEILSVILSELWVKIVQPVLNGIAMTTPVSQDLGRIWWCPTGPLAFLPIHAAGRYGEDQVFGSKLSDFLISSYTPSMAVLIQGYRPQSESQEPSAHGQHTILGTREEIKYIQTQAAEKVPVQWLDKDMATIDDVQQGMMDSRWSASPTESALLLAGSSRLTLSNIIKLSLPNADLAFLSACQTATGSEKLQDESVHLTAGMLLAGYRGVIGTMWSIMDNDAPQVAGDSIRVSMSSEWLIRELFSWDHWTWRWGNSQRSEKVDF
ncbi:TPR-like protein [Mycena pura]|uniref:TPR-like protein n=1 Tax=Mycena pura TaxID=153505 RepID=A0AAD6UTS4_9AGAR|nr:TPR-like protein [Mycena pura]